MPNIILKDVIHIYKTQASEVQALRGVDLQLLTGAYVAIMGPSGSGKTTLLNIIGGLDQATGGHIQVGDYNLSTLSLEERTRYRRSTIGYVFQNFNLLPSFTVAENIEIPMVAVGTPQEHRDTRVKDLLALVQLEHRREHFPRQLSGGEQQRVAIASALANDPPILLADEPTGELDTESASELMEYFKQINNEFHKTILVVTHDPRMARETDQIYRLEDGRIMASYQPTAPLNTVQDSVQSYADQLRDRLQQLRQDLMELERNHQSQKVEPKDFVQQHQLLEQTIIVLTAELQRLGY